MNIIEAIGSGKRFRRIGALVDKHVFEQTQGWIRSNHDMYQFSKDDFISNEWEVEPEPEQKIELTKEMLGNAWNKALDLSKQDAIVIFERSQSNRFQTFLKELGFK